MAAVTDIRNVVGEGVIARGLGVFRLLREVFRLAVCAAYTD